MSEQEQLAKMTCAHLIEVGSFYTYNHFFGFPYNRRYEIIYRCELGRPSCDVCPDNPKNKYKDMR